MFNKKLLALTPGGDGNGKRLAEWIAVFGPGFDGRPRRGRQGISAETGGVEGNIGAGEGNRTLLASLEDWSITTMLRPLKRRRSVTTALALSIRRTLSYMPNERAALARRARN